MAYKKRLYDCKYKAVYKDNNNITHKGYAKGIQAFTDKRWKISLNPLWILLYPTKIIGVRSWQ